MNPIRLLVCCMLFAVTGFAQNRDYYLLVGTYTKNKSKGIYVYRFDEGTGNIQEVSKIEGIPNPSYLTPSPNGQFIYAVNENGDNNIGQVSALRFDNKKGTLSLLNKEASGGDSPCYISTDVSGKWVFVANYMGGNCVVFPVKADGSLAHYTQIMQHEGHGPNANRQEKAHVHTAIFTPDQHYLLTTDLGTDEIVIYNFNKDDKKQPLSVKAVVKTTPGAGPRHIAFDPKGTYAYLMEELSGMVSVFRYNNGSLRLVQHISAHPADFKGQIGSADIHLSPDGRFLYTSNRGQSNTISIFSVDAASGKIKPLGHEPVHGATPRNFVIDPSGRYLLVANQDSDNIVIFKRNAQTGLLQATDRQIRIGNPVCLKMLEIK